MKVAVAVNAVVLTLGEPARDGRDLDGAVLQFLARTSTGAWELPGRLLAAEEDLDDAAEQVVCKAAGQVRHLEQLATIGRPAARGQAPKKEPEKEPEKEPGRVVTVAYLALVPRPTPPPPQHAWWGVGTAPVLSGEDGEIVRAAVVRLRAKLSYSNVAYGLLPDAFTFSELQAVYESVLGHELDKRNFRKKVLGLGLLVEAQGQRRGSHRPAQLYRFARPELVLLDDVITT